MTAQAHKRRRALKRRDAKPKHLHDLFGGLSVSQFQKPTTQKVNGETMKAKCIRLADRSVLVGKTVFAFDRFGLCVVIPDGRGGYSVDFANLLKLNGVKEVKDVAPAPSVPAALVPKPALASKLTPAPKPAPPPAPAPKLAPAPPVSIPVFGKMVVAKLEKVDELAPTSDPVVVSKSVEKDEKPKKKRRGRRKKEND